MTQIMLTQGDITELVADAIVNPANEDLILGAGVAGAILDKGGYAIQEDCDKLAPVATGQAVATGAGDLAHRWVIHAVAPAAEMPEWRELLATTIGAVLDVAEDLHATSVVMPALGTGIFGLPVRPAAQIMLAVVRDRRSSLVSVARVTFCLYTPDVYEVFRKTWEEMDCSTTPCT